MLACRPVEQVLIRAARDEDGEALVELVRAVHAEHPGMGFDEDAFADLRSPETTARVLGGAYWVAEHAAGIAGCVGYLPLPGRGCELVRLYVAPAARRSGLGHRLCVLVEEAVAGRGAAFIGLWSDTRLAAAHRLYHRCGYRREGERTLGDGAVEHYFHKEP